MFSNLNIYKLIVLVIIGIVIASTIVLAFVNAKSEATSRQRTKNADKVAEALKIYHEQNGFYPVSQSGVPEGIESYLDFYPADSKCSYRYERLAGGSDYKLTSCDL